MRARRQERERKRERERERQRERERERKRERCGHLNVLRPGIMAYTDPGAHTSY